MTTNRPVRPSDRLMRSRRDDGLMSPTRVLRAAIAVARVGLELVLDHRGAIEHAIDVVDWWCQGEASAEGVRRAHQDLTFAATKQDLGSDRTAWHAARAACLLAEAALEPMPDLAAKRLWELVESTLDAMTWPDCDDPALRAEAEARLLAVLDEAARAPR